ncbi:hypothetical protein AX15_006706 [Amanita polypyramis BW_CC]|nr:hypothetical protein AX15_006706 [Amanita polypyramis BW_CC]
MEAGISGTTIIGYKNPCILRIGYHHYTIMCDPSDSLPWSSIIAQAGAGIVTNDYNNPSHSSICDNANITHSANFGMYDDAAVASLLNTWTSAGELYTGDGVEVDLDSGPHGENKLFYFGNVHEVTQQQRAIEHQMIDAAFPPLPVNTSLTLTNTPASLCNNGATDLASYLDAGYSFFLDNLDDRQSIGWSHQDSYSAATSPVSGAEQRPNFSSFILNGLKYYRCHKCDYETRRKGGIVRHSQRLGHSPQRQYRCLGCGGEYTRKDGLKRHEKHCMEIRRQNKTP